MRSALQAETKASVAVVEEAVAFGLNRVMFESDPKVLVGALNSSSHELSEISGRKEACVFLRLNLLALCTAAVFVIRLLTL
jgi:hypothetical protein